MVSAAKATFMCCCFSHINSSLQCSPWSQALITLERKITMVSWVQLIMNAAHASTSSLHVPDACSEAPAAVKTAKYFVGWALTARTNKVASIARRHWGLVSCGRFSHERMSAACCSRPETSHKLPEQNVLYTRR